MLYSRALKKYYYTSMSNLDNNEGFDINVVGTSGDFDLYVSWPTGASGCSGDNFQEPYTAAWVWGSF